MLGGDEVKGYCVILYKPKLQRSTGPYKTKNFRGLS